MPKCAFLQKGNTISIDGSFSPCCQFEWQHPAPTNYQDFIQLRQSKDELMQSDEWIPECRWCKDDHEFKGESMKDYANQFIKGNHWELYFNNTCNLACRMCYAWLSSTWEQNIKRNPNLAWDKNYVADPDSIRSFKFDETVFYDDLPNVRHLKLLGGEPFLMKEVKRVLDHVMMKGYAHQIDLHVTTNLMQSIDDWWQGVFASFRTTRLIGSVDGLGQRYDYIRPGAKFETAMNTVQQIKKITASNPKLIFNISCTGQTLNASQYNDIKTFWKHEGIQLDIEQMYYPEFMSYRSLHPDLRKQFGIETTLEYDPKCFEKLVEQMHIQDSIHGTSFNKACPELFF